MKFQKYLVLGILALEFTTCICQFGGELMGGDMLGLFGGLAFMSGHGGMSGIGGIGGPGGMSTFGGMGGLSGLGGMGGMGGLGGLDRQGGVGELGGMSSVGGMDRPGEMTGPSGMNNVSSKDGLGVMDRLDGHTAINESDTISRQVTIDGQNAVNGTDAITGHGNTDRFAGTAGTDRTNQTNAPSSLTRAVQYIVGTAAVPDQELLNYAMRQGRGPSSRRDLVRYIPHMQRIARATYGEFLAHMASKNASSSVDSEKASNSTRSTPVGNGKPLSELLADLDAMVLQRAADWSREQRLRRQNNVMTVSRTMPQWFHMF